LNPVQDIIGKPILGEKISGSFKIQDPEILEARQLLDSCEFNALFQWAGKPDTMADWSIHPPMVKKGRAFLLGRRRFQDGKYMVTVLNDQDSVQQTFMLRYDRYFQLNLVFPLSLAVKRPGFRGVFESNLNFGCDSIAILEHGECWDEKNELWHYSEHTYLAIIDLNDRLMYEGLVKTEHDDFCPTAFGLLRFRKPHGHGSN
jgi:hypothetical protein